MSGNSMSPDARTDLDEQISQLMQCMPLSELQPIKHWSLSSGNIYTKSHQRRKTLQLSSPPHFCSIPHLEPQSDSE
ncbi:hypothetical protein SAY87_001330 [Trapa incisa]|uniref:Uncharacterized protein n=1 Tax=Trapa incisa TaxID=236973 RepID=A0AAN7GKA9_9MYRT|nr:hypothetical protein SAY87_001330 [Trapa incisa]